MSSETSNHLSMITNKKPRFSQSEDSSQLFTPFRAIGLITNEVPFVLQSKGIENFAITCIGDSYHIYKVNKYIWID